MLLFISSVFLLTTTVAMGGWEPYSTGFYLNFGVFVTMAIFINSHNYRLSLREYQAKKTLEQHSETDPLTGLYNRRKLDQQMQELSVRSPAVLVVLDVDNFKQVNDRFGHTAGDTCLEQVAQVLTSHFGDQMYRMGGDEFAVLSHLDMPETCSRIDGVNLALRGIMGQFPFSISAGLYALRGEDSQKDAFQKADQALYRAKNSGGNGWTVYEAGSI